MRRMWILAGMLMLLTVSVVLAVGSPTELAGASRCRECHPSAYTAWERSAHARAHQGLPDTHKRDPRCTQCHGTGEAATGSVQCESCHGAGSIYARRHVMKDAELSRLVGLVAVEESVCRRCHTDSTPSVRAYEHARMWQAIQHGDEPKPEPPAAKGK